MYKAPEPFGSGVFVPLLMVTRQLKNNNAYRGLLFSRVHAEVRNHG